MAAFVFPPFFLFSLLSFFLLAFDTVMRQSQLTIFTKRHDAKSSSLPGSGRLPAKYMYIYVCVREGACMCLLFAVTHPALHTWVHKYIHILGHGYVYAHVCINMVKSKVSQLILGVTV